jgi:hypothetical protein
MTGGTTKVPSWWTMNTKVTRLAKGDLIFVFGEREGRTLDAQLVLFAAQATTTHMAMATHMATATHTATAQPTATVPAPAPTGVGATITGTHF